MAYLSFHFFFLGWQKVPCTWLHFYHFFVRVDTLGSWQCFPSCHLYVMQHTSCLSLFPPLHLQMPRRRPGAMKPCPAHPLCPRPGWAGLLTLDPSQDSTILSTGSTQLLALHLPLSWLSLTSTLTATFNVHSLNAHFLLRVAHQSPPSLF